MTAAAGAPFALAVAILLPGRWYAGLAWPIAVLVLTLADALLAARPGPCEVDVDPIAPVGGEITALVRSHFPDKARPRTVQIALGGNALLEPLARPGLEADAYGDGFATDIAFFAKRRGMGELSRAWVRCTGPLGLAWRQREDRIAVEVAILPDSRPVRDRGAQLFQRHALQGLIAQIDRGDGAEFEALVEYRSGMDRRSIDWKQSARHHKLHAKEYRTERNSQIVFAMDCGRQMSEPVSGVPRIDRAVSAMLLCAWVALKLGDRVAIDAFDSRPRLASGLVSGSVSFGALQLLAASIDYSIEETNYIYALTRLGARLTRRSMIVLFTELTDAISADFLVRAVGQLVSTHLVMVVVLRDKELETIAARAPDTPQDVTRAVTAGSLLDERQIAMNALRHLGVHVIESPHDEVPERLVSGYLDIKRRALL